MSNWPVFEELEQFPPQPDYPRDFHSYVTIQLGELVEGGWVHWYTPTIDDSMFGVTPDPEWVWDYYDLAQYKRVCDKFNDRFYWDEISMLPPLKWKQQLIRKLNEIMPKYKMMYKAVEGADIMAKSVKYGKSRNMFSEFPETQLNGNGDYVSNGNDREYEDVEQGGPVEMAAEIRDKYSDVDVLILDELECMFSGLIAVNANGF